jgi:hypothetical protein
VPPFQVSVPYEVVERGPEGEPRHAELAAEAPFGRDRLADLELVDQLEHTLPGQDLFAHEPPIEAQAPAYGQDHFAGISGIFKPLTGRVVYANVSPGGWWS